MSMTIRGDRATMYAIHDVSKNTQELTKQLQKVSTGLKIQGAADAAAEYSISERMRCKLRGLDQAMNNTQTGKSMIDMAAKAVSEQTDIMKQVHTVAMRASDDTYSNDDRVTLQKEVSQLLTQIDEIAHETTYNGIHLLDQKTATREKAWFDADAPYRLNPNGVIVATQLENGNINDHDLIDPATGQITTDATVGQVRSPGELDLDFDILFANGAQPDLKNIGFSLNCGACDQFVTVQFDPETDVSNLYIGESATKNRQPLCYVIGTKGVTDAQSLMEAVFNGVSLTSERSGGGMLPSSKNESTTLAIAHDITLDYDASSGKVKIHKNGPDMTLMNGVSGEMKLTIYYKPEQKLNLQTSSKATQNTMIALPNTTLAILFPSSRSHWDIDPEESDYPTKDPKARQKWKEDTWPYPSKRVDLDPHHCLETREKANEFLEYAQQALKYLLNAATTLGVQSSRLETTGDNLVSSLESLQASESSIRDADMAKEMVGYVRANVMVNSSQAMLSQANQSSGSVLNLLAG